MSDIVVIGAGQAGASLVARLRTQGHTGGITLIGAEAEPPYQRPPLSKAYLLGEMTRERLFLRPESFYAEQDIDLRLGTRVTGIDPAARTVRLGDGDLPYDHLALTTGSVPRHLPAEIGGDLDGVFTIRDLSDVDRMAPRFTAGARLLVVGGGYIGLEAAAVAAKSGLSVTLVEMGARILGRVASAETAEAVRALHREHGVDLREGTGLVRLTGEDRVTGAELSDGSEIPVDLVVAGVGIAPATDLAETAGIALENGIRTDATGRTSDPAIWAAGDCASFPQDGVQMRLESVGHAIDHAELVADNMLGAGRSYVPKPWFWSDQYGSKLQIAGLGGTQDRVVQRHGPGGRSFWYYDGPRLIAVDALDDPRAYMVGKRLIEAGRSPAPEAVADPATDLKALLAP